MQRHIAFGATFTAVSAAMAGWLIAASLLTPQVPSGLVQGSVRDPAQTQGPQVRVVPVGTASISGTVTAADGGRPVRDARVVLNGAATVPEGALPAPVAGAGGAAGGRGGAVGTGLSVSRTVVADASGGFTFAKLPAGHFTLNISKNNFLTTNYGQKRPGAPGATIVLAEGQHVTANSALMRGGVITGTIYGDDGDPVVRTQVMAWRYSLVGGARRLMQGGLTTTDDRGVYRLSNLQAGDYLVSATPNGLDAQMAARVNPDAAAIEQAIASGTVQPPAAPGLPSTVLVTVTPPQPGGVTVMDNMMNVAYLPTYQPGTPVRANAQVFHVTGGDEHPGADLTVQYAQAGLIVGTIASPLKPGVTVRVSLLSEDPTENTPTASLDQKGTFTFRSVAPGKYTVMAQTVAEPVVMRTANGAVTRSGGSFVPLSDDDRLWGSASATVEGSAPTTVTLALRPGASISGVVMFQMEKPPDLTRARLNVTLSAASGTAIMGPAPQGQVGADGRFELSAVTPGHYVLRVGGAGTMTMKSAMVGGVDTLDFPMEFPATSDISDAVLTVTDKLNELSGTLTETTGKPGIDYTIIAAAVDDRFWTPNSRRIGVVRSGADGKYTSRTLPPGDYYLVVVTDLEQGAQYDPEFLKSLGGLATRVTVTEGTRTTQDLRVR
jgi:protocatechuate 3,4-dioxygenase beta subunit